MLQRHIKKTILVVAFFELAVMTALADAPYEKYHVTSDDIAGGVLENTIGILTINSGKRNELKTYLQAGGTFSYHKTLLIKEETRPISNFGYGYGVTFKTDEYERLFGVIAENGQLKIGYNDNGGITVLRGELTNDLIQELGREKFGMLIKRFQAACPDVENYRFPVVETLGEYVRLIYDPVENMPAWINLREFADRSNYDLIMIDSLAVRQNSYDWIDIFPFTTTGKRKLYQQPRQDAPVTIITKADRRFQSLKIMAQQDGYLQVGTARWVNDEEMKITPIGWIRIRDDANRLMLWIVAVDNC